MSKENERTSAEKEKSGLRIAQILAAALAAVTAALLGSTIGVAGTVVGAGLASIITTVGGELYLRSLRTTKKAALRAREALTTPAAQRLAEQPTVQLPLPDGPPSEEPGRLRKLRWPLIIGTSAVAFVVALLAIVGFESATGTPVGGGTGPAIGKIFGGGHSTPTKTPASDSVPTPSTTSTPTTTPSTPTTSSTAPSTSSSAPTTTSPPSSPTSNMSTPTPTPTL